MPGFFDDTGIKDFAQGVGNQAQATGRGIGDWASNMWQEPSTKRGLGALALAPLAMLLAHAVTKRSHRQAAEAQTLGTFGNFAFNQFMEPSRQKDAYTQAKINSGEYEPVKPGEAPQPGDMRWGGMNFRKVPNIGDIVPELGSQRSQWTKEGPWAAGPGQGPAPLTTQQQAVHSILGRLPGTTANQIAAATALANEGKGDLATQLAMWKAQQPNMGTTQMMIDGKPMVVTYDRKGVAPLNPIGEAVPKGSSGVKPTAKMMEIDRQVAAGLISPEKGNQLKIGLKELPYPQFPEVDQHKQDKLLPIATEYRKSQRAYKGIQEDFKLAKNQAILAKGGPGTIPNAAAQQELLDAFVRASQGFDPNLGKRMNMSQVQAIQAAQPGQAVLMQWLSGMGWISGGKLTPEGVDNIIAAFGNLDKAAKSSLNTLDEDYVNAGMGVGVSEDAARHVILGPKNKPQESESVSPPPPPTATPGATQIRRNPTTGEIEEVSSP
jgi:hypothetical protein